MWDRVKLVLTACAVFAAIMWYVARPKRTRADECAELYKLALYARAELETGHATAAESRAQAHAIDTRARALGCK